MLRLTIGILFALFVLQIQEGFAQNLPASIEGLPYQRLDKYRPEGVFTVDDYKTGKFNLSIAKKGEFYYWNSFGGRKLEVIEIPKIKNIPARTVFYDPKGEGKIYIFHGNAITGQCPETDLSRGTNYIEYRLPNNGTNSAVIAGTTISYPFPVSDNCKK